MNIRIDERLKARGDRALEATGWNPSQAARALWSFAAEHADDLQGLKRELEMLAGEEPVDEAAGCIVEESWEIVRCGLEACGASFEHAEQVGSDNDLRDRAMRERMAERGLL